MVFVKLRSSSSAGGTTSSEIPHTTILHADSPPQSGSSHSSHLGTQMELQLRAAAAWPHARPVGWLGKDRVWDARKERAPGGRPGWRSRRCGAEEPSPERREAAGRHCCCARLHPALTPTPASRLWAPIPQRHHCVAGGSSRVLPTQAATGRVPKPAVRQPSGSLSSAESRRFGAGEKEPAYRGAPDWTVHTAIGCYSTDPSSVLTMTTTVTPYQGGCNSNRRL